MAAATALYTDHILSVVAGRDGAAYVVLSRSDVGYDYVGIPAPVAEAGPFDLADDERSDPLYAWRALVHGAPERWHAPTNATWLADEQSHTRLSKEASTMILEEASTALGREQRRQAPAPSPAASNRPDETETEIPAKPRQPFALLRAPGRSAERLGDVLETCEIPVAYADDGLLIAGRDAAKARNVLRGLCVACTTEDAHPWQVGRISGSILQTRALFERAAGKASHLTWTPDPARLDLDDPHGSPGTWSIAGAWGRGPDIEAASYHGALLDVAGAVAAPTFPADLLEARREQVVAMRGQPAPVMAPADAPLDVPVDDDDETPPRRAPEPNAVQKPEARRREEFTPTLEHLSAFVPLVPTATSPAPSLTFDAQREILDRHGIPSLELDGGLVIHNRDWDRAMRLLGCPGYQDEPVGLDAVPRLRGDDADWCGMIERSTGQPPRFKEDRKGRVSWSLDGRNEHRSPSLDQAYRGALVEAQAHHREPERQEQQGQPRRSLFHR
jgi:hypothetical protein